MSVPLDLIPPRSKEERIRRLRERVKSASNWHDLKAAMLGILDLLADEL